MKFFFIKSIPGTKNSLINFEYTLSENKIYTQLVRLYMANIEELSNALSAHAAWKQRLRNYINTGEMDVAIDTASQDDKCAFGKWLYSLPASERSGINFSETQKLHSAFHHSVGKIITLAQSGNKMDAYNSLSAGSEFSQLSSQLSSSILKWKEAVLG